MASLYDTRRYLTNFETSRVGHLLTDVLVVGGGIAGARAAIEAATYGDVILIAKQGADESNTLWAQGGVPLGGIGCGKVEVCRDGRFRNFTGNNNQDMPFEEPDGLDGAYLAVSADGAERALATRPAAGLEPAPALAADMVFPQATLSAPGIFSDLDVSVRFAGPTGPHDLEISSLPGFLIRWTVANRRPAPVEVTCRLAWPNLVGCGGGVYRSPRRRPPGERRRHTGHGEDHRPEHPTR